ncbi:Spy/CpxP family protein refolding chaperone [Paraburkholderia rhizosphaerae]|uniref:LTXXQ motif family protein n=1 Tax=Paraburkholderia rhizosphaerae TaxID=480658 RepID=A0A4R8L6V1_9BURK|nr:Spy/CpxP family protein refolding chaperone [Paraburkholderia rhizosphaerae]TDY37769.1 LTXXQ motif family protein [Paraburkholderia rhizosphaerae]
MKKTLVLLVSALSISGGAFAQTAAPSAAPAMSAASGADKSARREERVEQRIAYLHQALKITPQQETQWNAFADVMRGNGATMSELFEQRHANKNISALDDMKQYAEIAQAHADGTKKLVDAFQPLYDSMPAEQKKLADVTFREAPPQGGHRSRSSGKKAAPSNDSTVKP